MMVITIETTLAVAALMAVARYRIFPANVATPMVLLLVGAVACGVALWFLRRRLSSWSRERCGLSRTSCGKMPALR